MPTALDNPLPFSHPASAERLWWPVLVGLVALYLPLYHTLATMFWDKGLEEHEPLVLAASLYFLWRSRNALFRPDHAKPLPVLGWGLLVFGLFLYVIGESQTIMVFAVGSQIPVLAGLLLLSQGIPGIRVAWFPILFLAFLIPVPEFLVDAATTPLKQHVSLLATQILYRLHYPVARSGVIIAIGPYRLLVADACSGLHSIISLSAMGLLYLYLMRHHSRLRNLLLTGAILPIAFLSNVVRVVVLALITYRFGDQAGQGFLHGFAGVLLFVVAVLCLYLLDGILGLFLADSPVRHTRFAHSAPKRARAPRIPLAVAGAGMVLATILGFAFVPRAAMVHDGPPLDLARMIPKRFGGWQTVDTAPLIVNPETQAAIDRIYNQVLSRTYVDAQGQVMMLSIAYGARQGNSLQLHKPEVCYPSQGFTLLQGPEVVAIALPQGELPVRRLVAERGARVEPITYWIKIGDAVAGDSLSWKLDRLKYGLTGVVPDGLIFRVSTITRDDRRAYALETRFIRSLLGHLPSASRQRLIGRTEQP